MVGPHLRARVRGRPWSSVCVDVPTDVEAGWTLVGGLPAAPTSDSGSGGSRSDPPQRLRILQAPFEWRPVGLAQAEHLVPHGRWGVVNRDAFLCLETTDLAHCGSCVTDRRVPIGRSGLSASFNPNSHEGKIQIGLMYLVVKSALCYLSWQGAQRRTRRMRWRRQ